MAAPRFFFDTTGHDQWFLIPAAKRAAWAAYKEAEEDRGPNDDDEPAWVDGVVAVGHPSWFTFADHHHGQDRDV